MNHSARASSLAVTIVLAVLVVSGCGQGPRSANSQVNASCTNCSNGSDTGGGNPDASWSKLDLKGATSSGPYAMRMIDFDPSQKTLKFIFPIPGIQWVGDAEGTIPEMSGARFKVETDANGQLQLVLHIPLTRVLRGIDLVPSARLPNGDALPGYPDGEGPRLGVKISRTQRVFYVFAGKSAAAVFFPIPELRIPGWINPVVPILSENQRRTLGYFSVVGEKNQSPAGVYVSAILPPDLSRAIDNLL